MIVLFIWAIYTLLTQGFGLFTWIFSSFHFFGWWLLKLNYYKLKRAEFCIIVKNKRIK
jgi:hypothetical protein